MMEKLARTGIAAIALASAAMAYSGLSAQQQGPRIAPNTEYVTTYYSSASHTTEVGYSEFGCAGTHSAGTRTSYFTDGTYLCNP